MWITRVLNEILTRCYAPLFAVQPDADTMDLAELDASLIDAHARNDIVMLSQLYSQAGTLKEAMNDIDAACFYWTQAYIFALDAGQSESSELAQKLISYGRLHPQSQNHA